MRINHNIAALKATTNLNRTGSRLDKSLERLSSGYKINRAADDAAGMSISRKMKTQIAALDQASQNGSDGISVLQTAEGALTEVGNMIQRMRELAVQAANGTNTDDDRQAIQDEINQLQEEVDRISETTEFNTKKLLDGSIDRKCYTDNKKADVVAISDEVAVGDYVLTVAANPQKAEVSGEEITVNGFEEGELSINGVEVSIQATDTSEEVFEKIRTACDKANITVSSVDAGGNPVEFGFGSMLKFESVEYGSKQSIQIESDNVNLLNKLGLTNAVGTTYGVDAKVTTGEGFSNSATAKVNGNQVTITDSNGFKMKITLDETVHATGGIGDTEVTIKVLSAGSMPLQIGANENQIMDVAIPKVDTLTLGIDKINLGTVNGAQDAISKIDSAMADVTAVRAKLGAYENRLEYAISNVDSSAENLTGALSRIEDTDMAKEMATFTQMQVLSQAGTSMLAQANERPQTILSLLQG